MRHRLREAFPSVTALFSILLLATGPATAQTPPPDNSTAFQVENFEPQAAQGVNLLNLLRAKPMPHLRPSVGVFFQYVDDPLELVQDGGAEDIVSRLVQRQIKAEVYASLGLFDFMDIGIVMPFVLSQEGQDLGIFNRPGETIEDFALGDLRITPKIRVVDPISAGGFGLAVAAHVYVPTGDDASFNSTGDVRVRPTVVIDWTDMDSGFGIVANAGYEFQPKTPAHNLIVDDGLHWGVGLEIPTPLDALSVVSTVHGIVALSDNRDPLDLDRDVSDVRSTPVEVDAALQLRVSDFVGNIGGGAGLTKGAGSPDFRLFLSAGYVPSQVLDTDGDGYLDTEDGCPLEPEDFDGFEDADGCPDDDNDGDNVKDRDDGTPDSTGYGNCRDNPEDIDGFQDGDGCPDPDNDNDGILDVDDKCPNEPEDKDGHKDTDGCPDPDNDGDGVLDVVDGAKDGTGFGVCRDQPETKNSYKDEDGCPDEAPRKVRLGRFKIEILEKVYFDYDKATIKPVSFGLLDEVARVINEHPMLTKLRVEGHTDHRGSDAYNNRLSQARSESVRQYLTNRGVAPERLVAQGFGERRPIVKGAEGKTEAGMARNRRVEIFIIEVNGKPHSPDQPVIIERTQPM